MPPEIERKFLVSSEKWRELPFLQVQSIVQNYLSFDPQRIVRVRVVEDNHGNANQAYLTIKGKKSGYSCPEFEYPIPADQGAELLELCEFPPIRKRRYWIEYKHSVQNGQDRQKQQSIWQVDEFAGALSGLVLAEVELESEEQRVSLPPWIGAEVSTDHRYANAQLIQSQQIPLYPMPSPERQSQQ